MAFALGGVARAAGYRLRGFDKVGSTNTEAREAALAGDTGGVWFAALEQTEGRGRRGRAWHNPRGNLAATLLIVPDCEPQEAAPLGFVAGLALSEALERVAPRVPARLKWPNDVLVAGAKLSGILLEAIRLPSGNHAVAIGMGTNVVAAPEGLTYPATSLAALGATASAEELFAALTDAWVPAFALWRNGLGLPDVLARWTGRAAGIGGPVSVRRDGETIDGDFETLDGSGRMIVRSASGERIAITAGDVYFGEVASAT